MKVITANLRQATMSSWPMALTTEWSGVLAPSTTAVATAQVPATVTSPCMVSAPRPKTSRPPTSLVTPMPPAAPCRARRPRASM
jgi:hypothetical protein